MAQTWHPPAGPGDEEDLLHGTTRFVLVRHAPAVRQGLALFTLLFALVPLAGHLLGISALYRMGPEGAGTPPMTLGCIVLLSLVLLIQRPLARPHPVEKALLIVAGGIALGMLGLGAMQPGGAGGIRMGTNTAICILALVSAMAIRRRHGSWPALLLGGAAWMICMSAFLGYAMGLGQLHGALSPTTLLMMTPLVLAAQIAQARRPPLRALFRDDMLSRMLRFELALAVVVPTALGVALFRIAPGGPSAADAIYMQAMILFCCTGVLVAGRMRDRLDRERRALSRELERASFLDPLTGLANRRGTMMMANHAMHAARRGGRPVSLVLCDLDHFKAINDRLGHGVGDRVLQAAATLLAGRVRLSDIAGRWGGEEFLFILPGTPLAGAEALAEILRTALYEELRIMPSGAIGAGAGGKPLTASFGCAAIDVGRADGFERALEAADGALYAAKRLGRNQVASGPALAEVRTA